MNLEEMLQHTDFSSRMPYVNREPTFRAMCDFIRGKAQTVDDPVIFETGCVRSVDDWGAGNSTVIFDLLLQEIGRGYLTSVDITPDHVKLAQSQIRYRNSEVLCDNSLTVLARWTTPIDLLYLDSFDLDINDGHPSSLHHMMELALAWQHLRRPAMVAIDDNFSGEYRKPAHRYKGSKGTYVKQFMEQLGIKPVIDMQQTVWLLA
jgi:predicted O-methyltransferase YrrM